MADPDSEQQFISERREADRLVMKLRERDRASGSLTMKQLKKMLPNTSEFVLRLVLARLKDPAEQTTGRLSASRTVARLLRSR